MRSLVHCTVGNIENKSFSAHTHTHKRHANTMNTHRMNGKKHHNLSSLDERCSAENVRTLKKSWCCGRLRLGDVLMLLAIAFSPLSKCGGAIHNQHCGKLKIRNYIFLQIARMNGYLKYSALAFDERREKVYIFDHFHCCHIWMSIFRKKSTSGLKDQSFSGEKRKCIWFSYVLCFDAQRN